MNKDNVTVILPAFNEEESIGDIIDKIKAVNEKWEVLVVNDASSDNTASEAEKHGAKVVTHTYNLGNGASVKTGAKNSANDILVFMDSDGQHPPEKIPELIKFFPDYDLVIGSRTKKSKTNWVRNIGNFVLIQIAKRLSGYEIKDLTSGFRAVKKETFFEFAHLYPLRYSYPTTITLASLCSGKFVLFVDIPEIVSRQKGKSGISPILDGIKFIKIILRVILLFHPARIFIPMGAIVLCLGLISGALQLYFTEMLGNLSILLFQTSFVIFLVGIISEQISLLRQKG
jgi:glycosyltransferase involved in cell wall biosynthesis